MSAAGAIPKMLPKAAQYLGAAGAGAGVGALTPTLGEESRASNAATGAIFGAGGQAVGDLGGRAIEGLVAKNPNLTALPQKIRDRMSLGQVADRNTLSGRIASTTEEKLQSVPFVGNRIKNYRQKAVDTWRDDVIEQGAPKGFIPQGETPREKIADAYGEYGRRYSSALRGQQVSPSQLFESQVLKITNDPRSGMTQKAQDEVRDMTMNYYRSMFHGNPQAAPPGTAPIIQGTQRGTPISADAETAKKFEAFLTKKAMEARKSNAPGASEQAKMFEDMERAWSVSYRRQLPSSTRRATRELDQTYPTHKNAQRAASYVGNDYGEFTPQQLIQAILNVVRNAMEALLESSTPDPGIRLRTRAQHRFTIGPVQHALVCRIDITDNGPGIPRAIRDDIFFPMISGRTTGTGLGLPIAQSIISNHHGLIEYESVPGHTEFSIFLPTHFSDREQP
jgi:hypothetical protein